MMPIGPLMMEHRLSERMIKQINKELSAIGATNQADPVFIDAVADFFRTYADMCHHGKEEEILFKELAGKPLTQEHRTMIDELVYEHALSRETINKLVDAKSKYLKNEPNALQDIVEHMTFLADLYPKHIEKEDKHFFFPSMDYFTKQEQDKMIEAFWEFDRKLIHEAYKKKLSRLEETRDSNRDEQ